MFEDQPCPIDPVAFLNMGEVANDLVRRPRVGRFARGDPGVGTVREHGLQHVGSSTKDFLTELEREVHGFINPSVNLGLTPRVSTGVRRPTAMRASQRLHIV